jgi:hypothetical protein
MQMRAATLTLCAAPREERIMSRLQLVALSFLCLAACGGGGSDSMTYQQDVDQASRLEAQALALGVDTPCSQSSQCGVLTFLEPSSCPGPSYKVYSMVSASAAAASAAAAQEVSVAEAAIAIAPPPTGACTNVIIAPPIPVCVANHCVGAP